jgi:hypothetical protein
MKLYKLNAKIKNMILHNRFYNFLFTINKKTEQIDIQISIRYHP